MLWKSQLSVFVHDASCGKVEIRFHSGLFIKVTRGVRLSAFKDQTHTFQWETEELSCRFQACNLYRTYSSVRCFRFYILVVMFHYDTTNIVLLCSIRQLLESFFTILRRTSPSPRLHCGSIFIREPPLHPNLVKKRAFILHRNQLHIIVRHGEVEHPKAGISTLILRRFDNSVNCSTIITSWEKFESIPSVYDLKVIPESSMTGFMRKCRKILTKALSTCLTQRHFPSGDIIWRAATGCDQRRVRLPWSILVC